MGHVQSLNNFSLNLDIQALSKERPELQGAEKKLEELKKLIKPKVFWREMVVDFKEKSLISFDQGRLVIDSAYVAKGIENCQKATLLAATIGEELPRFAGRSLKESKYWEGTLADILGSYAVELLVEKLQSYFSAMYLPKGIFSTLRFSPGYGDWQLSEQKKIITYLEADPLITVNSNFLLEPVKSITALIGWATSPQTRIYPQGDQQKAFCNGGMNCTYCQTWACRR